MSSCHAHKWSSPFNPEKDCPWCLSYERSHHALKELFTNVAPPQRLLPPGKPEQLTDAVLRDHRHEAVSASGTCALHGYPSAPGPHGWTDEATQVPAEF